MNIFGDIEGNFLTFKALLNQMPKGEVVSLGDLNDRGPRSKELIQWFIDNKAQSLFGNHEHMFIDFYYSFIGNSDGSHFRKPFYQINNWLEKGNGGWATLKSYGINEINISDLHLIIPKEHINWLESRPYWIETDHLLLTHAAKHGRMTLIEGSNLGEGVHVGGYKADAKLNNTLIWNPSVPKPYSKLQIYGHMASDSVKYFSPKYPRGIKRMPDDTPFAICLDTSLSNTLSALHYPSMTIFSQKVID